MIYDLENKVVRDDNGIMVGWIGKDLSEIWYCNQATSTNPNCPSPRAIPTLSDNPPANRTT